MDRVEKSIPVIIGAVFLICGCLSIAIFLIFHSFPIPISSEITPTAEQTLAVPIPLTMTSVSPAIPTAAVQEIEILSPAQMLETLQSANIPAADLESLAIRFKGYGAIPAIQPLQPVSYQVGDALDFWVIEEDDTNRQIHAKLQYITDNAYYWIEDGIPFQYEDLKHIAESFSEEIYPRNQSFFGTEWLPGIDNDSHVYILFARGLGESIAGYSAPKDSVSRIFHPYSNEHEMFIVNADVQSLSDPYTLSVMAHEYQHLIHQYHDPNEELWFNEGFSELAALINGYGNGGFDFSFMRNPDIQLNDWAYGDEEIFPHYGASFLFMAYLLSRFGDHITQEVVAESQNGFASIDNVFQADKITDPISGKIYTADHLFADWAVTNYLQDDAVEDGRFTYAAYPDAPRASPTEVISDCESRVANRTVAQYGTDYIEIRCGPESIFTFSGMETVRILPEDNPEGNAFMWSNTADSADTTMTKEFDFTGIQGQISASFDLWYDLEEGYDFAYFLASENGKEWSVIGAPGCSEMNLSGNNYGCGWNGSSGGWENVSLDLSAYAGKKVMLRFEMITDGAVLGEGLAIDNFYIRELDFLATFNTTDEGWEKDGFVRLSNLIPQTFLVSVIDQGTETLVREYFLQPGEKLELPIRSTNALHPVVIVISGSARFTRQPAFYQYSIDTQ